MYTEQCVVCRVGLVCLRRHCHHHHLLLSLVGVVVIIRLIVNDNNLLVGRLVGRLVVQYMISFIPNCECVCIPPQYLRLSLHTFLANKFTMQNGIDSVSVALWSRHKAYNDITYLTTITSRYRIVVAVAFFSSFFFFFFCARTYDAQAHGVRTIQSVSYIQ